MDLLLVTGRFPERSETFIYRKATALARRGHRVTVLTRQIGDWSMYPDELPATLRIEQLPPDDDLRSPSRAFAAAAGSLRYALRAPRRSVDVLDRCRRDPRTAWDAHHYFVRHVPFVGRHADVVHFEFLSMAALYPLVGDVMGVPVVVSCRGSDLHTIELRSELEQRMELEALRTADAIHCVSAELAAEVTRLTGRTEGIRVNRGAVDTAAITERPPMSAGRVRILATGRLIWKKGFDYLLASLAQLARRGVDFEAEILGDGELKSYMRFSIEDLGLHDRVTLAGAVSSADVLARLQRTDIFVLSSLQEGISNAALEAMASGVAIVSTSVGGMPEALTDGVEAFLVPPRDVVGMTDRIEQLARDPDLRRTMGHAARLRAEREFSTTRQISTFEDIYRSVLESRG